MRKVYSSVDHTACMIKLTVLYEIYKVIQDKIVKEQKILNKFKEQEKQKESTNGSSQTSID